MIKYLSKYLFNKIVFQTRTPRRAGLLNVGVLFFILFSGMIISLFIICAENIYGSNKISENETLTMEEEEIN